MKKILITGANSFIGISLENYLKNGFANDFTVETADMIDGTWRERTFSSYDTVFHVAGLAHVDVDHITEEKKALYYKVNTDLAVEVAVKAKAEGIKQFIFMSSAIVYGDSAPLGKSKVITKDTEPTPANFYGESKLRAELGILPLQDDGFRVVILRCPMIYGKGSRGNYPTLSKFARKLPIFPYAKNERSMLYVENLCEFVRLMIQNEEAGVFFPQNGEYSNTAEVVRMIASAHGKKIWIVKGFGWALKIMSRMTRLVNKAFGSLSYDMSISEYKDNYRIYNLKESIERTEG